MVLKSYNKGQKVFSQNDKIKKVYLIRSGEFLLEKDITFKVDYKGCTITDTVTKKAKLFVVDEGTIMGL